MKKIFYRIRNLNSLLGKYKELENQEIFFQTPEKLNDPMEGFMDFVFDGDEIVWRNFFEHYIYCLNSVFMLYYKIIGEKFIFSNDIIPIFHNLYDVRQSSTYIELQDIPKIFFDLYGDLIDKISKRTTAITKNEFLNYLYTFNYDLLEIIQKVYEAKGLMPKREQFIEIDKNKIQEMIKAIDALEELQNEYGVEKVNIIHQNNKSWYDKLMLELSCVSKIDQNTPNKYFIMNFHTHYLEALQKLAYPKIYVASFLEDYHNSSVWGNYGENHSGVCLIFEADENNSLNFLNVLSGNTQTKQSMRFQKVNYDGNFEEINFFESFGLSTEPTVNSWYMDENKNKSNLFDEVINNQEKWRDVFWSKLENNKLIKTKDWSYENEYRITWHRLQNYDIEENYRKLKYDFNSLKGLIFGIKTPLEKKCEIIEIIKKKCMEHERCEFEFYQAYYCNNNKDVRKGKLNIDIGVTQESIRTKLNLEFLQHKYKAIELENRLNKIMGIKDE
ncbi:DUF2971 domain-containing protein [Sulfurospirillum barnesii]|uniref:DUF2971 domain-containing protein n=1 Tax=Sulfurospirillum barnesii (strain ATCC 700032 / DSM 10660 / SES-3) TaxID=760154 RepID=I3XUB8_SULBS|nr:DUF2971 domain-containing protein [Sulfurospirillum barnesii]AFL67542.1 Protein of unknown function (DUF2971) [Sulfurospirillum barnesii SES-3]